MRATRLVSTSAVRRGRGVVATTVTCALLLVSANAAADTVGITDPPGVFSLQPRLYLPQHEFALGAGIAPLDAFYIGAVLQGSYTYHFTETWAWEMINVGYAFNLKTALQDDLLTNFGVQPSTPSERISLFGSTSVVFKPLFGKFAWLNRTMVHAETYLSLGAGPLLRGDFWRAAVHVGAGLRVWSTRWFSVRLDVREVMSFSDGFVPKHDLIIGLSGAYTTSLSSYDTPNNQVSTGAF